MTSRAFCPVCRSMVRLRKDGLLSKHRRDKTWWWHGRPVYDFEPCAGSEVSP